jgi:hypothetical protein
MIDSEISVMEAILVGRPDTEIVAMEARLRSVTSISRDCWWSAAHAQTSRTKSTTVRLWVGHCTASGRRLRNGSALAKRKTADPGC